MGVETDATELASSWRGCNARCSGRRERPTLQLEPSNVLREQIT